MLKIDPTILLAIVERASPSAATVTSREAYALMALHAGGQKPSAEARLVSVQMIEAYVDAMRDADYSPQQVVIAIKAMARRAWMALDKDAAHPTLREQENITEECVSMSIRRFFLPRQEQSRTG